MRLRAASMLLCTLITAAAPALGASREDHNDCNSDDPNRNIVGCSKILEDPGESDKTRSIAYVGRGIAWQIKHERELALSDFTDAIRLDANNGLAYNNRAIIWREKDNVDRAIADFTEAIRINPLPRSDLPGLPHINIYSNRGLAWQAKGDFDRAQADFDQAISLDGNDAEAYFRRAQLFMSKPNYERAASDLGAVIRLDPTNIWVYYLRGSLRHEQYLHESPSGRREDLEGAITDYTEVIRLDPKNVNAYHARGLAWNVVGNTEGAIADLTEAARLNPLNLDVVAALKILKPDYQAKVDMLKLLDE